MTVGIAWGLAAAAGAITGAIAARRRGRHASPIAYGLAGALLAALAFGGFLAAGTVVSLLFWSDAPDPIPALLGVVLTCAGFLLFTWAGAELGARFGLPEPRPGSRHHSVEDILEARPVGGAGTMWLAGVGLALIPILYGARCVLTQSGVFGSTLWNNPVEGGAAIALGLGWIGVGAFLHFHFFFGLHPRLQAHSEPAKRLALIVACAGFGLVAFASIGAA